MGVLYFVSWQQSAGTDPFPPHALSLAEDVPNPDALYRSLDMLTDELPVSQNDSHSTNRGRNCVHSAPQSFFVPASCISTIISSDRLFTVARCKTKVIFKSLDLWFYF